jgi:hypothetical protein
MRYAHRRGSRVNRGRAAFLVLLIAFSTGVCISNADDVLECCGVIACGLFPPEYRNIGDDMPRLAEQATFLFVGKVVKAESVPCCDYLVEVTLRASKVWKGLGLTTVVLHTGEAAKRPSPFTIGQEYLVATLGSQDAKGRHGLHPGFSPIETSKAAGLIQALDDWRRTKYDASQSR